MTRSHDDLVQDQFGPRADAYVQSPVHAAGEDLDALEALAEHARPRARSISARAAVMSPIGWRAMPARSSPRTCRPT
jgi:hypothetical protein